MLEKLRRWIGRYTQMYRVPHHADSNALTNEEYCAKYGHKWVAIRLKDRWEEKRCVRCGATRIVDIINP